MSRKPVVRGFFAVLVLVSAALLAVPYVHAATSDRDLSLDQRAPPAENITVITTQDFEDSIRDSEIIAYAPNGSVLYHNDTYKTYMDVDPVPGTRTTVLYVADESLGEGQRRSVIETVNLTTGDTERLYTASRYQTGGWHDVDRIGPGRFAVADINGDRVIVLNGETGVVEWAWDASRAYPDSAGGPPQDWTHMNDVDRIGEDRFIASVRNMDQVVFLDRETGRIERLTLGTDDGGPLYEQHNPDYIPEERGGPALIVADSENNRVLEFQRRDGEWVQSWEWQDDRIAWPRDADRLPNGNTLITDSNGDRVIEVNETGAIVWSVDIGLPYEAERLGTGDGSAGGPSAASADLQSRQESASGREVASGVKRLAPSKVVNALKHVTPVWMGVWAFGGLVGLIAWAAVELWWAPVRVDVRSPVRVFRE